MCDDLVKTLRNNAEHYMTENGKHSLVHAVLPAKTWRNCASRLIPAKESK